MPQILRQNYAELIGTKIATTTTVFKILVLEDYAIGKCRYVKPKVFT